MDKLIKYYRRPVIKNAVMLASWPGMGKVSLGAIDYLREKLGARLFAEVDTAEFTAPEVITVKDGLSSLPSFPRQVLYFSKEPDIIFSIGERQIFGQGGIMVMEKLLDIAEEFKVKRIFTAAAFPLYMSYRDESRVYAVANFISLRDWLKRKMKLEILKDGQISGLNGLLLGFAKRRKIEAICLLATLPIYAVSLPNPKASKTIVEALVKILNISVDLDELKKAIQKMDSAFEEIEGQLRDLSDKEPKKELPSIDNKEIPKAILDKIEKLFEEAKKDRRMAHRLKEELDKWNLFKAYEDRFLDLFKESH